MKQLRGLYAQTFFTFRTALLCKNVKDLKYGMVALQRRGVVFMTVLLRNTRTYLVGLRPANLLSLHFNFYFHLSIYMYLVDVIQTAVVTLTSLITETLIAQVLIILQALSCVLEYHDIVSLCLEVIGILFDA